LWDRWARVHAIARAIGQSVSVSGTPQTAHTRGGLGRIGGTHIVGVGEDDDLEVAFGKFLAEPQLHGRKRLPLA
jgi:hypothetical protein